MKPLDNPDNVPFTLTERLAADRTELANERTLLAYGRTALGLVATGTGFSNYLDSTVLRLLFLAFIPLGVSILVIGVVRFRQRQKHLTRFK